jgi:hypothetical protein
MQLIDTLYGHLDVRSTIRGSLLEPTGLSTAHHPSKPFARLSALRSPSIQMNMRPRPASRQRHPLTGPGLPRPLKPIQYPWISQKGSATALCEERVEPPTTPHCTRIVVRPLTPPACLATADHASTTPSWGETALRFSRICSPHEANTYPLNSLARPTQRFVLWRVKTQGSGWRVGKAHTNQRNSAGV